MFNQERGAGKGKAAAACPNSPCAGREQARPEQTAPGMGEMAALALRLHMDTGRAEMERRGGPQLPALAFGFVKCLRLARRAVQPSLTWKKGEEGVS